MSRNKETVDRYMEGFRKSDHQLVLSCLAEDIEWDLPGAFHKTGKKAFNQEIVNEAYLPCPEITVTRLTEEGAVVAAQGTVRTRKKTGELLTLKFCDLFVLHDAKIRRLTSYLMAADAAESTAARVIKAPRPKVYAALVDGRAFARWLPPAGTTAELHEFTPKVGGRVRMQITHAPGPEGTRLFELVFVELRPDEAVVFAGAFLSDDPALQGGMRLTLELADAPGGTLVTARHEGIPPKLSVADNQKGSRSSLDNLARLLEQPHGA